MPRSPGIANPLIAIESEAPDGSVVYRKIFKERVETSKMDICSGAAEASDELPFVGFFVAKPGGVNGGIVIAGLDAGKEAIGFSGLPWIFQKTLSSGSLAPKFLGADVFSFG